MKSLDDGEISQLTALLNESLANGEIANDWLDSHLAALPKPEKDHTKISAYRIITMQNCFDKLLETLTKNSHKPQISQNNKQ